MVLTQPDQREKNISDIIFHYSSEPIKIDINMTSQCQCCDNVSKGPLTSDWKPSWQNEHNGPILQRHKKETSGRCDVH